jgi:hypothetical protein
MSCYGFGSLHYILFKGSSFSLLGGFQNVPGTDLSSHCHFCGGFVTSILSILNVGYDVLIIKPTRCTNFSNLFLE